MKKLRHFLIPAFLIALSGCHMEIPRFTQTIIDPDGPNSIWMKTFGDINADGETDILVGGRHSGGLVAYLAPGWEKQVLSHTLKISTDAEVRDLDNDGFNDVVAITHNALVWLRYPGWDPLIVDSTALHDIEVEDYDGDGLIDIVGRNQAEWGTGDTLFIFQQKPLGTWTTYKILIPNGEGVKSADINGDEKPDIIINGCWYENTGDIRDWNEHKFSETWEWRNTYIDVADMNNDGRADILLSPSELAGNYYHVSWFEAPKDPTSLWDEHVVVDSIETVIHFIGAADFNLDRRMDFMIAHMQQGADPDEVAIYYQDRDHWEKQVISQDGSHSMRLLDCDRDGDVDAFGANWRENIVKMWVNEKIPGSAAK